MKVLVAVDGSAHSSVTLGAAARILSPADRDLEAVCIVPILPGHVHRKDHLLKRAEKALASARKRLTEEGVSARTRVLVGSPARELIRASRDFDAVVIAAQSRRQEGGLGPVTSRVAEHANSHVLIARPLRSDGTLRILVPVDGSDASLRALELLAALVDLSSAEVTLIHVVETHWLQEHFDDTGGDLDSEDEIPGKPPAPDSEGALKQEMEREAQQILSEAAARLPHGSVRTMVCEGLPAEEILGELGSEDYDLAVVSSTHSADLKHKLLGSVSSEIAWNAPCSVLAIHAQD